jgi:hypothetical protein
MNQVQQLVFGISMVLLSALQLQASTVALRLGTDDGLLGQYKENPNGFPACREGIDFLHFDSVPVKWKKELFRTNQALIEKGAYDKNSPGYTGDEVVERIASYEKHGWEVCGVFVYREEWLGGKRDGGEAGPFAVDRRILSLKDLQNIRSAIARSKLKCRKTVRIIQLLGGRTWGQRGDSWTRMDDEVKRHLLRFDGIGTECHIGDHVDTKQFPDGRATLQAMAEMTKWALDNRKIALVFMGGGPKTYENPKASQNTYQRLWDEMDRVGVKKNAGRIVYFRQGARDGKQVPESESNTLTYQIKWLIEQVK